PKIGHSSALFHCRPVQIPTHSNVERKSRVHLEIVLSKNCIILDAQLPITEPGKRRHGMDIAQLRAVLCRTHAEQKVWEAQEVKTATFGPRQIEVVHGLFKVEAEADRVMPFGERQMVSVSERGDRSEEVV